MIRKYFDFCYILTARCYSSKIHISRNGIYDSYFKFNILFKGSSVQIFHKFMHIVHLHYN
jgi:hypothetical protein